MNVSNVWVLAAGSLPGRFLVFSVVPPFRVLVWHMPPGPRAEPCRTPNDPSRHIAPLEVQPQRHAPRSFVAVFSAGIATDALDVLPPHRLTRNTAGGYWITLQRGWRAGPSARTRSMRRGTYAQRTITAPQGCHVYAVDQKWALCRRASDEL
jgi:hypothetical protein